MKTKTVRRGRFALGLLIYILVFAILAGAALLVFRQYLAAYEESRLSTAVKNYHAEMEKARSRFRIATGLCNQWIQFYLSWERISPISPLMQMDFDLISSGAKACP